MIVNLCTCTNEPLGEDLCARSVIYNKRTKRSGPEWFEMLTGNPE